MPARIKPALSMLAVLLLLTPCASGQGAFSESFDQNIGAVSGHGPSGLTARGWVFRNQSQPTGDGTWYPLGGGWQRDGSGCIAIAATVAGLQNTASARASSWAILPAVANQRSGDVLKFWVSNPVGAGSGPSGEARLEVRYSPGGGSSTGSGATAVGDFSTLLWDHAQDTAGWTQASITLPGSGRIALRFIHAPSATNFSGSFLIDTLSVGAVAAPIPLPAAGQTLHWTLAGSPYILAAHPVTTDLTLPVGGTVIVDAGVEVRTTPGVDLIVAGEMHFQGAAGNPVRLRGAAGSAAGYPRIIAAKGGLITGVHCDVETFTDFKHGGRISFTDSVFRDPAMPAGFSYDAAGDIGHRFTDGNLDYARQIVALTRCTFGQGCAVSVLRGWAGARDCTFTRGGVVRSEGGPVGGEAMFIVGASRLQNVSVVDAYIDLTHDKMQHRFIGDLSVTGNPYGPGIRLQGGASYLIDPTTTLQGHKWPVNIGVSSAGILPGSRLPAGGNEFNEIPDTDDPSPLDERVVWADAGIPYITSRNQTSHGQVKILPGVTVKIAPGTGFYFDTDSHGFAYPVFLGEPERPIRFIPSVPGARWLGIGIGNTRWFGARWEWCTIEDSEWGVGSAELPLALDNCVFRRNIKACGGSTRFSLRKCTFENNVYSYSSEDFAPNHDVNGFLDANHPANPNTFINNRGDPGPDYALSFLPGGGLIARATHNSLENTDSDARNNWWGTPTGPRHPTFNPGGEGDDVFFGLHAGGFLTPFLTQPPTSNPPPVVRFVTPVISGAVPGEKIVLQWSARDDTRIVSQRVYYSPDGNGDPQMQLLAELPAAARSYQWRVPAVGTPPNNADQFLRIVAVDDLGQEGIGESVVKVANPAPFTGVMTPSGGVVGEHRPGTRLDACAAISGNVGSMYAALELDNDETGLSLGGVFGSGASACTILGAQLPDVSTDRARLRFDATGTLNQVRSYYGPWFSIRPDPLLGDAPPSISLTSTHAGIGYAAGSSVRITWNASDDEALRSFDIRASFDGGTRWFIVARDLPPEARSYDWRLAGSTDGIAAVRLRVVAKDRRFQNSSAESGVFSITPGSDFAGCAGDFNGDSAATIQDLFDFLGAYFASSPQADVNHIDGVTVQDVFDFLRAWFVGC